MIKISAVSYLNTIPFIDGLRSSSLIDVIDLQLDYPSVCAKKLIKKEVDLALVPVVVIPKLENAHIISDYCIGANGAVDTVCLYSDVPINHIRSITLDYQSETSVALLKILLKEYWMLDPELKEAKIDFEQGINGRDAALVIGDRAFSLNKKHQYIYDLSFIWRDLTGLPFVFAVWVANKELPEDFILTFNKALQEGLSNIENNSYQQEGSYRYCDDIQDYLSNKISYVLDARKLEAMQLFLGKI